jgi:hypothetical protein
MGRELFMREFDAMSKDIPVETNFPPGYYIFSVEFNKQARFIKVLIE